MASKNAKKLETYARCPCGQVPTDIMINMPQGSKYGTVAGNCCGDWMLEFKAGYPKDNNHLIVLATNAWNSLSREGVKA